MEKIAEWHRSFQVWQYSVSHSTLLLRSVNVEGFDTRIDVVFTNVELMLIKPVYDHLRIDLGDNKDKERAMRNPSEYTTKKELYFLNGESSYVIAGKVAWHEDHGDHHTPSKFGPLRGTE
jgi:hypothetical protein